MEVVLTHAELGIVSSMVLIMMCDVSPPSACDTYPNVDMLLVTILSVKLSR
jgi:hypothetical protein